MAESREREAPIGMADRPDPSVAEGRSVGTEADRAPRSAKTPAHALRNALQILNVGRVQSLLAVDEPVAPYRETDVAAVRMLVLGAIEELEGDRSQLQRNLDRAQAEIRRLMSAMSAPKPTTIACLSDVDDTGDLVDTLVVALSDGSFKQYWPQNAPADRWRELGTVPSTRAAILEANA